MSRSGTQISFRRTIVILCSLAAVVPVLVLAIPFVSRLVETMRESADRELQLVAEGAQREVEFRLGQIILQSRSLTQDGDVGRAVRSILFLNRADIQLRNLAEKHSVVGGAYLLNIRQEIVTAFPDRLLKASLPPQLLATARQSMLDAQSQNDRGLVAVTVLDDTHFSSLIESGSEAATVCLFISVPGVMGTPAGVLLIVIPLARLNVLASALARAPTEIGAQVMAAGQAYREEQGFSASIKPVKWPTEMHDPRSISIIVREPMSFRLGPVKATALRWSGLAALLAAVFGLLGYRLSRSLSAPFAELSDYAEAFGRGYYSVKPRKTRFSDFAAMYTAFAEMARKVEQQVASEKARAELEMNVLRNQMSPHFLFNSLNSVATMVTIDPNESVKMITKLSAMYRAILDASNSDTWALHTELELVANYLDLEKMRFADRLTYQIDVPQELRTVQVPSLIVQTLVENAIKHGIAPSREGGEVRIQVEKDNGDWCKISVTNSGASLRASSSSKGTGLVNSRRRLEVLFGGDSDFRIGTTPEGQTAVSFRVSAKLARV